jgi:hypothetical protein
MSTSKVKIVVYERCPSPEGIIVLKRASNKKRQSRKLRGLQKLIRLTTKHHGKAADIYSNGVRDFAERSERSSEKKKDGLLKDLIKNSTKSARKTFKAHKKLPGRFISRASKVDLLG